MTASKDEDDLDLRDLDVRGIGIGGAAIVLMILLTVAAAWLAWRSWRPPGTRDGPDAPLDFPVAGARLESGPFAARDAWLADKERQLHAWEWLDARAGIARIPIEDAMRLMARERSTAAPGERRP